MFARLYSLYSNDDYLTIYNEFPLETIKEINDPYLNFFYAQAVEDINLNSSLNSVFSLLNSKEFSNDFMIAWSLLTLSDNRESVREQIRQKIENGEFDSHEIIKEFFNRMLPYAKDGYPLLGSLKAMQYYVSRRKNDPAAYRYLAHQFRLNEQFDSAAVYYQKAFELNPFYRLDLENLAEVYAREFNFINSEKESEKYASLYFPNNKNEIRIYIYALSLNLAGEKGRALEEINNGLKDFPDSYYLNLLAGNIYESYDKNELAAQYFSKALKSSNKLEVYENLLKVYHKTNDWDNFSLYFDEAQITYLGLTENCFYYREYLLEKNKEYQLAEEAIKEGIAIYPYSGFLLRRLAMINGQSENYKNAVELFEKSFQIVDADNWSVYWYNSYLSSLFIADKEQIRIKLKTVAEEFPWVERTYEKLAELNSGSEEKIKFWKNTIAGLGSNFFPYKNLIEIYLKSEDWESIDEIFSQAENKIDSNNFSERFDYLNYKLSILREKLYAVQITKEEYKKGFELIEQYQKLKGNKDILCYRVAIQLEMSQGNKKEAVKINDEALDRYPDDYSLLFGIKNRYLGDYTIAKLSSRIYRALNRDPFNKSNYRNAIETHIQWGGSPLTGLVFIAQAQSKFPEENYNYFKSKARGQLGDNYSDYENIYRKATSISPSKRYVSWYNNSRWDAWKGSAKLDIDYENAEAIIYFPDGTIAKRQDDIRFGKIKKIQSGDAYISADYNSSGLLIKLESSAGKVVQLSYDADSKIDTLKDSDGNELIFRYNQIGKPIKVISTGTGEINVSYDENGKVQEIKSEQGHNTSLKITNTISKLTKMVNTFNEVKSINSGSLPDLGIPDKKAEELKTNYSDIYYSDDFGLTEKSYLSYLDAAIFYADYLYSHTFVNSEYSPTVLDLVIEVKNDISKSDDLKVKQNLLIWRNYIIKRLQKLE